MDQNITSDKKTIQASSLGEMASVLMHELTQPLTIINNFISGCIYRLKADNYQRDELLEMLREAEQETLRAGIIVYQMKDFICIVAHVLELNFLLMEKGNHHDTQ